MRRWLILLALPALLATTAPASLTPQARVLLALNYTAWHAQAAQGEPECSWTGVTCEGGAVTGVDVMGGCYSGSAPSGTLPAAWSQLTALRSLSIQCYLSGTLPPEWSKLAALQRLDLNYNKYLSGTLPPEWSKLAALQHLSLTNNNLSGPLPPEWSELAALQELSLVNTNLSGTLPSEWSELAALQELSLASTNLSGTLPPAWSELAALQRLKLASNNLSGTLPPEWSELAALQELHLDHNNLSGTLPPEWTELAALQELHLDDNNLSGTLPPAWSKLAALQKLWLTNNNLSGPLPPAWSKLAALQSLWLTNNNLSGTLPPEWSRLARLENLGLSSNALGGWLPDSWPGGLPNIQQVDLRDQRGAGFHGLPDSWRQFCVRKIPHPVASAKAPVVNLYGSGVVPSGISGNLWIITGFSNSSNSVKPEQLLAYALAHRDQWRTNACVYPGAGDYLIAMLVLISSALACMLAAACWLRCRRHRAGDAPALAQMLCVQRLAGRRWLQAALPGLKLALLFVRPAIVLVDVVSDCLTIAQVWSADPQSWAGPVLLSCVFLPEVLTALCLTVATAAAAGKLGGRDLARPAWPARPAAGWRPWLAWALALLKQPALLAEHAVLSAHARSGSVAWRVACAALSWPLLLLTMPLLVPFGVIDEGSLQRLAPHEAAFITWRPARAATLWSWCSGGIEAPVSGGLLLMLLLLGVRPDNSYVIEQPAFLYLSLSFSLVHVLLFVWDMLSLWATSCSRAHWAERMRRPFVPAVAVADPAPGTAAWPASAAPHAQGQAKDVTPVTVAEAYV